MLKEPAFIFPMERKLIVLTVVLRKNDGCPFVQKMLRACILYVPSRRDKSLGKRTTSD